MPVNTLLADYVTIGLPSIGQPRAAYALNAVSITVSSPVIKWDDPLDELTALRTTLSTQVEPSDPTIALLNRRATDRTQSIHTWYNDDIVQETDASSLIGRADVGRGPAQKITIAWPLKLIGKELSLDADFLVQIAALQRHLGWMTDEAASALQNKVGWLTVKPPVFAPVTLHERNLLLAVSVTVGSPVIGVAPRYSLYATSLTVSSPVVGVGNRHVLLATRLTVSAPVLGVPHF